MRRLRMVATVLALLAAGCGGGGSGGSGGETTSSAPVATTVPVPSTTAGSTVPPTTLSLHITDLHLVNAQDSDNGARVVLPAGVSTASVTLTGVPSPNQVVSVCQARELDHPLTTAVCRMPANGEAVTVALGAAASGVEIVQVGAASGGPGAVTLDDVTVRYAASTRDVSVRLPQIASGDSAGRPAFSLTPAGTTGSYSATLSWTVIQAFGGSPSSGALELVQAGAVAKRADSGGQQAQLSGNVPTPAGDAGIRVQNVGASAMISPKLVLVLP